MTRIDETIRLAHGAGGLLSQRLHAFIIERLGGQDAAALADGALLDIAEMYAASGDYPDSGVSGGKLVFTTDSFVVTPRKFPGGNIGKLAICGTVNDLAVMGARPFAVSLALVIEEGFQTCELGEYLDSAAAAAREAGVRIVTGDTKVVGKGGADGLFINTSGIGVLPKGAEIGPQFARPGQKILINGSIGDHSIAIVSVREGLSFAGQVESDCAPLAGLIRDVMDAVPGKIKVMRDPTRGGLASILNEIAASSRVEIMLDESAIPVAPKVDAACGLLGYDVLHLANEGKCVFFVDDDQPDEKGADTALEKALKAMSAHPLGKHAACIGEVVRRVGDGETPRVLLRTEIGGTRIVDVLTGDLLPRIC